MNRTIPALSILITLATTGCAGTGVPGINKADPLDPAGSASIGTGAVTSNSTIPYEAKAAGMGLAP